MVCIHGPFLGKPNDRGGKEDADDDADYVAEEGYEEASALGVRPCNLYDVVIHLDTTPSLNYGKECPRPQQHKKDANQQVRIIGSGAKSCYIWN